MRRADVIEGRRQAMRDRQARLLRWMAQNGAQGTGDIARGTGITPPTVRVDLLYLEEHGRVERYHAEFGGGYVWTAT